MSKSMGLVRFFEIVEISKPWQF